MDYDALVKRVKELEDMIKDLTKLEEEVKTIPIRIAVMVDYEKDWCAFGCSLYGEMQYVDETKEHLNPDSPNHIVWVEADIPMPKAPYSKLIKGTVPHE